MAIKKISELVAITTITADDLLLVVDAETSTTRQITAADAADELVNLPSAIPTLIQTELDLKLDASDYSPVGISVKIPVIAATTANITTLSAIRAGDVVDGVTLANANRLLVKNQSDPTENGIYVISSSTAPARAADFAEAGDINNGFVLVNGGTTQRGSGWAVQSNITAVDTDPIIFVQFSAALVGVTAASVGLGNVDNTSDLNKPLSTATTTALNSKQNTIIGGASTITGSNLTDNRVLISNSSGKVGVSTVTSTEVGHLAGVTSAIQPQLNNINNKANLTSPSFLGTPRLPDTTLIGTGSTTLLSFGIPAGAIMPFAMATPPAGWLAADGAAVSRVTYGALFAAIGTTYGAGDLSTTFNLPDLRGYFVRGSGTNSDGTASGSFGAKQADEFKRHTHTYTFKSTTGGSSAGGDPNSIINTSVNTGATGGTETRPRNIAMFYCIKF